MPTNLVEQSRHASIAEYDLHMERADREQSRFASLEFARRCASRSVTRLLAALDAEAQSERKQVLAIVVAIGGAYIVECERQINGEPNQPGRIDHLVRNYFDSLFWVEAIEEIYTRPNETQLLMLDVLQGAADFFKQTLHNETSHD